MKQTNKIILCIIFALLINSAFVYSYSLETENLLRFTPQDVAPAVGQALIAKLQGSDFDFQSILQSIMVQKVSAVRITGTCMKLGDLIKLFPEGKCGSTKAGLLYAAHELVLLGKCTSCIGTVRTTYTSCVAGCPGKCGLSVTCIPTCTAACEAKRVAGQAACANEYQTASETAAKLANNLRIAALAYGTSKGSFEGFPCDEILGSCIPTTDAFTDYGSLIACKDEAGLMQRLTTDLLTKRDFAKSVNNGFNPERYNEIISMGGSLPPEVTALLTKENIRKLSKEQIETAVTQKMLTPEQIGWLTNKQITDETLKEIGYTRKYVDGLVDSTELSEKVVNDDIKPKKEIPTEKPQEEKQGKKGFAPGEWIQITPEIAQALMQTMSKPEEQYPSTQPSAPDLAPYRASCEGKPKCKIPPGGKIKDGCYECCYGTPINIDPAFYCKTDTANLAAQDAQQKQEEIAGQQISTSPTAAVVQDIREQHKGISVDSSEYTQKGIKFCHWNGACVYSKHFYKNEIDLMQFYDAGPALFHTMEQGKAKNVYIVEGQGNDGLENSDTVLYNIDKDGQTEMLIAYGDGATVKDEYNNYVWLDTGDTLYSENKYKTNTNFMHINSGIIIKPTKKQGMSSITGALAGPSSEFNNINIKLDDIAPAEKSSIGIVDEQTKATIDIREVNAQIDLYADNGAFPIVIRENKAYGSKDVTAFIAARTYKDYELKTETDNYNIRSDNTSTKVTDKNNKVIQDSGDSALTRANMNDYQKNMLDALKTAQS